MVKPKLRTQLKSNWTEKLNLCSCRCKPSPIGEAAERRKIMNALVVLMLLLKNMISCLGPKLRALCGTVADPPQTALWQTGLSRLPTSCAVQPHAASRQYWRCGIFSDEGRDLGRHNNFLLFGARQIDRASIGGIIVKTATALTETGGDECCSRPPY